MRGCDFVAWSKVDPITHILPTECSDKSSVDVYMLPVNAAAGTAPGSFCSALAGGGLSAPQECEVEHGGYLSGECESNFWFNRMYSVLAHQNRLFIPIVVLVATARVASGVNDLSRRGGLGNSSLVQRDETVVTMEKRSEPFLVGNQLTRDCLRSGQGSRPYNIGPAEGGGRSFSIDWTVDGDSE